MEFLTSLTGMMSFTGVTYLAFLTLAIFVFFLLPGAKTRCVWLLGISSFFFMLYSPKYFWVIALVTVLAYGIGRALEAAKNKTHGLRKTILIIGIIITAAALIITKYSDFSITTLNRIVGLSGSSLQLPLLKFVMPIGISFWTFQTIAYIADVYLGKTEAEKNLLYFSASVIFFPIVTMGPITRVQDLVPQLSRKYTFDYERMRSGLLLMLWGYFKKLMIADRLAVFVGTVFGNVHNYSGKVNGLMFLVAGGFYAIQLYTDFSGYTDIVRGSARIFGVDLPLNFTAPYFARSVAEFWRRWHMTLMDWLKNYVYIPLGGNRKGKVRKYFNIMAVFFVSGLWHGAGFTYIIWGLLNGFYQLAGSFLKPFNDWVVRTFKIDRESSGHKFFQTIFTFLLITIAWMFFRANSLSDALYMVKCMFMPTIWIFTDGSMAKQGLTSTEIMIALLSIGAVWIVDYLKFERKVDILTWLTTQHLLFRWLVYYVGIFIIVIFGHYGGTYNAADFVYFKF